MCYELFVIALYVRGVLCMSVESNCYCVLPENGTDGCGADCDGYALSLIHK